MRVVLDDVRMQSIALSNLGAATYRLTNADYDMALKYLEQELELSRHFADQTYTGGVLASLGNLALKRKDYGTAEEHFKEFLAISEKVKDRSGEAVARENLGEIAYRRGDMKKL
jgi:tetratricopeptide (TPR) repeat protein